MSLRWLGIAGAAILAVLIVTWSAAGVRVDAKLFQTETVTTDASPHVMLKSSVASGSGVHIGNGFVLSAAHVVGTATTMQLKDSAGRQTEATVLWTNTAFDIALLYIPSLHRVMIEAAPLNCAPNYVGQKVTAYGNPMGVEFVYTRGEVNGAKRQYVIWKEVIPLDGTIVYGQSGGGIIDEDGSVVGITVGLVPTPYGIAAIGWAVPASAVCHLLGRST